MFCQPTSSFVRHGLVFTSCLTCREEYLIDRRRVCPAIEDEDDGLGEYPNLTAQLKLAYQEEGR